MKLLSVVARIMLIVCPLPLTLLADCAAQSLTDQPRYLNRQAPIEDRVTDLLARMTIEEKVAQLQCTLKKIEWGKNLTADGLGGVGPLLRSSLPADAARKGNDIQKLAVENTRLHIPLLFMTKRSTDSSATQ